MEGGKERGERGRSVSGELKLYQLKNWLERSTRKGKVAETWAGVDWATWSEPMGWVWSNQGGTCNSWSPNSPEAPWAGDTREGPCQWGGCCCASCDC